MANLSPIPKVFIQESDEDYYRASPLVCFLADLHYETQLGNHQNSWGLTIFRTVFTPESAETFPLAVKRINDYFYTRLELMVNPARSPPSIEPQARDELLARLYNTVIEDVALDGASIETVEQIFHDWVRENGDLKSDNPRYRFALVLDEEAIDETLRLPDAWERNGIENHRATCKGITRWCLDQTMSCQWFWAAPSAMPRVMMFSLSNSENGPISSQIEPIFGSDELVFETMTGLNRYDKNCNKLTGYPRSQFTFNGRPLSRVPPRS